MLISKTETKNKRTVRQTIERILKPKSYIGQRHFFAIIDAGNAGFALSNDHVIVNVVTEEALFYLSLSHKSTISITFLMFLVLLRFVIFDG